MDYMQLHMCVWDSKRLQPLYKIEREADVTPLVLRQSGSSTSNWPGLCCCKWTVTFTPHPKAERQWLFQWGHFNMLLLFLPSAPFFRNCKAAAALLVIRVMKPTCHLYVWTFIIVVDVNTLFWGCSESEQWLEYSLPWNL